MRTSLQRRSRARPNAFVVGTTVVLAPHNVRGIVIDLVLSDNIDQILYAVVAFDTGLGEPVIYQPIRWNLLRRARGEFVVNAALEAIETGIPAALAAVPLSYGGNARRREEAFTPTPQSVCVH
jgi:hypothetical protein